MRRVLRLAFVACVVLVACGTLAWNVERVGLAYSVPAAWTADSIWITAYAAGREAGACVASGRYAWGFSHTRQPWAVVDSFATEGPQGPHIRGASLNQLWWEGSICGDTSPSLHTHIQDGDSLPSLCDLMALAKRPAVPFGIVQWGVGRATLYTLTPLRRDAMKADTTDFCRR